MTQTIRLLPLRLGILFLSLLGAGSLASVAHAEDEPAWFQVEVVIFARTDGDEGVEQWPRNIQLRYPFNWVELQDPDAVVEPVSELENTPNFEGGPRTPAAEVDLQRHPFFQLPRGERQLNPHANAINRRNAYQVLFHEAWRQPVLDQQRAPALLITGGREFGDHYELEGSITLSLARYLHLRTQLWLTEFIPNFGQPPGTWPELPRRPNLQAAEPELPSERWDDFWSDANRSTLGLDLGTASSQPNFLGDEFVPGRIVTLNQHRRMRSRELHYIDHPLFGILIEITPYERPADNQEERR